jgi:NADPH-dependent glutamate synthase beta subunit-like oxidoreductase
MTIRISNVPSDPYLGYEAFAVARAAAACLQCTPPAPCTLSCSQNTDIPGVMRLAGQAACEGLSLSRWFQVDEQVESARICDAINDSYQ